MPTSHPNPLTMHHDFNMLGLPDLLLAREKNHAELMRKRNVVATAVGLYLIRKKEAWLTRKSRGDGRAKRPARTLSNSEVRPYSWPCVLVFVRKWEDEKDLNWEDQVPGALYLDDRRKVPVCVVEAPRQETLDLEVRNVVFPGWRMGGGFPVVAEVQGREHIASIGCLVTDGHTTYALTNRHVTGEPGEAVYSRFGGEQVRIGESSRKQLRRMPFTKLYPEWPGKDVFVNLDIGLIRIDDLARWTAQVFGIGTIGPMADLGTDNLSLRLIDCHVRAYGCASGRMHGAIKALFYRYKSVGGFEYVADFLIGAREERQEFATHPGDSGTLWLLESGQELMPIAVQWGGHVFGDAPGQAKVSCALATCLSTVCNQLDVDVIRDWNLGATEYWGEVGHYTIGAMACNVEFPGLPGLAQLMQRNLDRVGFKEDDLKRTEKVLKHQANYKFVPLADVADDVWRNTRTGGGEKNNDGSNHFADMDQKASSGPYKGKTLLDLCQNDANIDPQVWSAFYDTIPGTNPGALPFRVWQMYDAAVGYLKAGDVVSYLCAVGCMVHYVGDACQPLHISRLHHGYPPVKKNSVPYEVHAVYETQMLNAKTSDVVDGVKAWLDGKQVSPAFTGGFGAAKRAIQLMRQTVKNLPPADIVDAYNEEHTPQDRLERLWKDFGDKTIERLGEGCLCMAEIWASAWKEGNGESIPKSQLVAIDENALAALYRQEDFVPSMSLRLMIPLLKGGAVNPQMPPAAPAKKAKKKAVTKKKSPPKKAAKKAAA